MAEDNRIWFQKACLELDYTRLLMGIGSLAGRGYLNETSFIYTSSHILSGIASPTGSNANLESREIQFQFAGYDLIQHYCISRPCDIDAVRHWFPVDTVGRKFVGRKHLRICSRVNLFYHHLNGAFLLDPQPCERLDMMD